MDFLDDEAEESEEEEREKQSYGSKRKRKTVQAMEDSEEEEDDDEAKLREELKDLIDDESVDDGGGEDSDAEDTLKKRKRSVDVDYDDRLEDDDYELLEENLGIAVDRKKRFKRLRRVNDAESEDENESQLEVQRDIIAARLFDGGSGDDNEQTSVRSQRHDEDAFDEAGSESHYSDADDFIVDNDGRPITEKRRNKRLVCSDAALQEAQDIFGVDFDYDEFDKYGDDEASQDEGEEDADEYIDDDDDNNGVRPEKKKTREKSNGKTIFDIYEPSELKRGHFTDTDNEIRCTDIPERMQLRSVPVTPVPEGSNELDDEAEWIYRQAFCRPTISVQDAHLSAEAKERACKGPQTVAKIKKSLDFMRNQNFEVPFISFYRKEYVLPELNINDLWKIYKFDAKWCELRQRKERLATLFERMRDYQLDEIMKNPDAPLPESIRVIKEEDIDRLKNAETCEELNDVHHHFMLYYSHEIPNLREIIRDRNRRSRNEEKILNRRRRIYEAIERGEDPPMDDDDTGNDEEHDECLKQAVRTGSYAICRKSGLHGLAKKFGLAPEQFAENVRDNYQRHEVDQETVEPEIAAAEYRCAQFESCRDVVTAAVQMVAIQLAREPIVRKCVREIYMERAKLSVRPTKKGIKEIDENHSLYTMKYLKEKPVRELVGDQYLKLVIAERDKLVTLTMSEIVAGNTTDNYMDELKQLYHKDEFSKTVNDWNALRADSVEMALTRMIIPDLQKELRNNLMSESKEFILRACRRRMYNWIKIAPYACCKISRPTNVVVVSQNNEENWDDDDDDDGNVATTEPPQLPTETTTENSMELDTSKGLRVMGLAYVPDFSVAAFACIVGPNGDCTDNVRLPNILRRLNSHRNEDKLLKEADLSVVKKFIGTKKPHVIVIGGESREATMIADDLRECIATLNNDNLYPVIDVEICENEFSKIYAQCSKANEEFKDYPIVLRQAISLARRLQDPLVEFSQLCTSDNEIMCLNYHPLQNELSKEELLENLQLEFVNRVNEVGVDVNRSIQEGYSGNLLQFVCGLGERKAQALVKLLKQGNKRLENRTQLVTVCHMGPKIFINCAGFIKIDTNSLGDSTEAYVEVLDGTRVHPETYEWARKMAVDALEYDNDDDDGDDDDPANPAGALEEIFKNPDRLKDLDLDAFAEELERQGFGNKSVTLYDIRSELNCRYKDLRAPYESPNPEKLFDILTKETPESFYIGKLITATVTKIVSKKPEGEQLDQANPLRNVDTNLWQCPFCMKNDFPELSEVWGHFDAGECPGKSMGVRLRLDNGISGFVHVKNLSDKRVNNPEERVRPGQMIHCRIIKIEVDRFSVECTSKSSDLADKNNEMRPQRDAFYDIEAEAKDVKREEEIKRTKQQRAYMKRVIVHSSFHNISYAETAKLMTTMKQGEAIIRPSSKGTDHLTVTWKVTFNDNILHHIDVREEGKKFDFSLGKRLWIGTEEYEDLDEIIARHVNPMAAYAAELLDCNYYRPNVDGDETKADEILKERKIEKPNSIPCILSPSKKFPGKFLLSYMPREHSHHEYITVTPDGCRYRGEIFPTIGKLFDWFKKHFRDPRRVVTPKTPAADVPEMFQTRNNNNNNNNNNYDDDDSTNHHTLSLTADDDRRNFSLRTPAVSATFGQIGSQRFSESPYTPSSRTPFTTPHRTPRSHAPGNHSTPTPRYGQKAQRNDEFARPNAPAGSNYRTNQSRYVGNDTRNDDGGGGGGGGGSRGRRGNFRGRGGGGRGRGNSRGRGGFGRNDSYDENSKSSATRKIGEETPLWDETESWDSPPQPSNQRRPDDTLGNSRTSTDPSIDQQRTPLWDETESWDSPGEPDIPNASTVAKTFNESVVGVPPIVDQLVPWDPNESWDSPPSDDQQRNALQSSERSCTVDSSSIDDRTSQRADSGRGAVNDRSRTSSMRGGRGGRSYDRSVRGNGNGWRRGNGNSVGRGRSRNYSATSSEFPIVPVIGRHVAPPWDETESWDEPDSVVVKNFNDRNERGNISRKGNSRGQPPGGSLQSVESSTTIPTMTSSIVPLWNDNEDWDAPDPVVAREDDSRVQPPGLPQSVESSTTVSTMTPSIVPPWNDNEDWDAPDPIVARESDSRVQPPGLQQSVESSTTVPTMTPSIVPPWNDNEDRDAPDPVLPAAKRPNDDRDDSSSRSISQIDETLIAESSFVPIIVDKTCLWDTTEDWDNPRSTSTTIENSDDRGNSSKFGANGNRSTARKPNENWNSNGRFENDSRNGGRSSGNSSFQRSRGNRRYDNSGRWNRNEDRNSSGSGNRRGGARPGRFPSRNNFGSTTGSATASKTRDKIDATPDPNNDISIPAVPAIASLQPLWDESESWD